MDQINRFLIKFFGIRFDSKKPGRIKNNTAIKKIAGIICSNPTLTIPKTLGFLEEFFNTWIRFFVFNFSKSF